MALVFLILRGKEDEESHAPLLGGILVSLPLVPLVPPVPLVPLVPRVPRVLRVLRVLLIFFILFILLAFFLPPLLPTHPSPGCVCCCVFSDRLFVVFVCFV